MKLLESYRRLWPERSATSRVQTEEDMERLIIIELKDELTHPRVRKTKQQKLELAIQRINNTQLDELEKQELIDYYKEIADQIQ